MIGNGVCDMKCYSGECEWDGGDCGCADDCLETEYGRCKDHCLVPDCNYDALSGKTQCGSEEIRIAAKYYQLYSENFEAIFTYEGVCAKRSPACTASLWQQSYLTCVPACDTSDCVFSFGNCISDCSFLPHCLLCSHHALSICLQCEPGFLNFYGNCMSSCPIGFQIHPQVSDICYPMVDFTDETHPLVLYVHSNPHDNSGTGAYSSPFDSLSLALATIHMKHTIIYLFPGDHNLTLSSHSRYFQPLDSEETPSISSYNLTISGLTCVTDPLFPCSSPTLLFDNLHPIHWTICSNVTIISIDMRGNTGLIENCDREMCTYCPVVTMSVSGTGTTDQRVKLAAGTFTPTGTCEKFHYKSLFLISEGVYFALKNVRISDFRQEFSSLLNLTSAYITLTNVSFSNIVTSPFTSTSPPSAVLYQHNPTDSLYLPGYISLCNVTGTLLGNGFEYHPGLVYGGLVSIGGLETVVITEFSVKFSVIQGNYLIYIGNFSQLQLTNCIFDTIFTGLSMIRIAPTVKTALPSPITLTNLTFTHCSSYQINSKTHALVAIIFTGEICSISLNTLIINESYADGYFLTVRNEGELRDADKKDRKSGVVTENGDRVRFVIPKKWVRVRDLRVSGSVGTGEELISFLSLPNIDISGVEIRESGDPGGEITVNTQTVEGLIRREEVYLTLRMYVPPGWHCGKVIAMTQLFNVSISNSLFLNTACLSTSNTGGIYTSRLDGDFTVTNLTFHSVNTTASSLPCCLSLDTSGSITLTEVYVQICTMQTQGAVAFTHADTGRVEVTDCVLEGNYAQGALVKVVSGSEFTVKSCVFRENNSTGTSGIYFHPARGILSASISFSNLTFHDNLGSLISLSNSEDTPIPVLLSLSHLSFLRNQGAAVSLDPNNILLPGSSLSDTEFKYNSGYAEMLRVSFLAGEMSITRSIFDGNSVKNGGILSIILQSSTNIKQVYIDFCEFYNNSGPAVLSFISESSTSFVTTQNNLYERNNAYSLYIYRGIFTDFNSTYLHSTICTIYLDSASLSNFTHSKIMHGKSIKGAVFVDRSSTSWMTKCEFRNNTSDYGGALYLENLSHLVGTGLVFVGNKALRRGSAVYVLGTEVQTTLTDCVFEENWSQEGGTIVALTAVISVSNSLITRNSASFGSGVVGYFSTLHVSNCTFTDQSTSIGAFIYVAMGSQIAISRSQFSYGNADVEGGAVYILSATVEIRDCVFRDIQADHGAMISATARSVFNVSNTVVSGVSAVQVLGGIVFSMESSGYIDKCVFKDYGNGAIVGYQQLEFTISDTVFTSNCYIDGTASKGAGLRCNGCQLLSIHNSQFTSLTGISGVALYILTTSESPIYTPISISQCTFSDINGTQTGAVVINNLNAVISSSTFRACQATDAVAGYGGGLVLMCKDAPAVCEVSISYCVFEGNKAGKQGGSIHWMNFQPLVTETVFSNGEAFYGPDISSFPVELRLTSITGSGSVDYQGYITPSIPIVGLLTDLGSGQIAAQSLQFVLLDHYNQTVVTDDTSQAIMIPSHNTSVIGTTSATASQGIYVFNSFGVTAIPDESTLFYVQTSGIDQSVARNFNDQSVFTPTVAIKVDMRTCEIGEMLLNMQCVVCAAGKYSLDPLKSCEDCPDGAICYGGFQMVPREGYWRSDLLSAKFWKCPYEPACLGSPEPPQGLSLLGKCADGYFGNLCNGCRSGYTRQGSTECGKCPPVYQNAIRVTGIGIGVFVVLIIVIRTVINSAKKLRSYFSIFIKILLNYIQLVMLTASFQLQWPRYAEELFKVQQSAGSITEQIFSVDCFLDSSEDDSQAKTVRSKLIMMSVLPMILLAGSVLFWMPFALILRKPAYLKNELATTMVILFFLIHPSMIKFMFDYFNCKELDAGQLWMNSYLNIPCWDSVYYKYVWSVALPSILGWGVGVPALCLLIMWKRKRMLDLTEMKLRLGFLYNGYDHSKFYWEFIILYRKMAVISIAVFFTNISTSIQALTAMVVLLAAFMLHSKHQPFVVPTMNQLELRGILVAAVTIYCGLYYMTEDLGDGLQMSLFVIIVIVNAYFIMFWLVMVCKATFTAFTRRFRVLDRFLRKGEYRIPRNSVILPSSKVGDSVDVSNVTLNQMRDSDSASPSQVGNSFPAPPNSSVVLPEHTN